MRFLSFFTADVLFRRDENVVKSETKKEEPKSEDVEVRDEPHTKHKTRHMQRHAHKELVNAQKLS